MPVKWLIFFFSLFIVGAFFGDIMENVFVGDDTYSVVGILMSDQVFHTTTGLGGISYPSFNPAWWPAVRKAATFDFVYFEGGWSLVRWLLFAGLGLGFCLAIVMWLANLVRGN